MRRRCTCGALDVQTWRLRRGVLTESGFHRFDGQECQPRSVTDDSDEDVVRALYDAERLQGEKTWAELTEQAREIWRLHVAGKAGIS